jgi:SPP1 family predicted phage head-tail adaptor
MAGQQGSTRGNPAAVRSGRFRHLIQLASNVSSGQDSAGQPINTWTPYLTINAEIAQIYGQEQYQTAEFTSAAQVRISFRWPGAGITISASDRVFFGSHVYVIQVPDDLLLMNRLVNLICLEIDGTA